MKLEEINYQHPPNNETALHVATRKQHKEIIEILLRHGAQPSLRNIEGQQAHELAETEEIKNLFKRPKSSRFAFLFWKNKLYLLKKGYLIAHLQDLPTVDGALIHDCLKRALLELNPNYLVTAYSSYQNFSTLLNIDMARNIIHDLKNGCSPFSCQCLYSTGDFTKSISHIFLHHPNFQKLGFKGEVHRGIVMPKHKLDHYKVDSCIITTTFISTSKKPAVAEAFGDKSVPNLATHSFFCTYNIVNDGRTAIDISNLSKHPEEEEVLILPYSSFRITKIEEKHERTNIYLEEQCLADIVDRNQSHVY
jgi:hypothetical protein